MSEFRAESLTSWHAEWRGLRVAVLGLGASGFSSADTLLELGAVVTVFSEIHTDEREQLLGVIGGDLVVTTPGIEHAPEYRERLAALDPELVVVSPGFAADNPLVVWARERGVPVWGDIELAWRVRDKVAPAEWIVVAGGAEATAAARVAETILLAGGVKTIWCGLGGYRFSMQFAHRRAGMSSSSQRRMPSFTTRRRSPHWQPHASNRGRVILQAG
ncbi:hypothetical protein [Homoserinimonas hongtaonis]|uniref:hypothetical protein n=1 Tax=Homoserinimonas hongtaonis TaxID=2079791 RepID=UPI00131F2E0F|nr:hypothetical protein [Salinibacterium hongtaonis]